MDVEHKFEAVRKLRKTVSCFIPESILDQMDSMNMVNLLTEAHRWFSESKDAAYDHVCVNRGGEDMVVYLTKALKIPPAYFEDLRQKHFDPKQQVLEALNNYLTQELNAKQGAERSFSNDIGSLHGSTPGPASRRAETGVGSGPSVEQPKPDEYKSNWKEDAANPNKEKGDHVAIPNAKGDRTQDSEVAMATVRLERPINKYTPPRPAFVKTNAYQEVLQALDAKTGVVHIYGLSGNGKSQIVLATCQEHVKRNDRFVWRIADGCSLQLECQEFVNKLASNQYISTGDQDKILKELMAENSQFEEFFTALKALRIPVLFAVEAGTLYRKAETKENQKEKLQRVIQHVLSDEALGETIQFLIASNKEEAIFCDEDLLALPGYKTIKITGFTAEEAEKFLAKPPNAQTGEAMLKDLALTLAYSPLRLMLAKAFCVKRRVTYETYYKSLGNDGKIIAKEKEFLAEHPELGEAHGYEVIMKALKPDNESPNKDDALQYEVIQMMSFLSNEDIPDVILGRFFQEAKKMTVDDESKHVTYLMSRLETDVDLVIHEMSLHQEYGEELCSIHKDILNAVRLDMDEKAKRDVLVKVLHAVIGLVDKDNRSRGKSKILFRLMKHIEELVLYACQFLKAEFTLKKPKFDDFEIQMCLSRLYELMGFSGMQHSGMSRDDNFEEAVKYLWLIASSYSGFSLMDCFSKKDKAKDLLEYEEHKDPKNTAAKAYERIKKASQKIPESFVSDHYMKHYPIDMSLLRDIKTALQDEREIKWDEIEHELQTNRQLSKQQLQLLEGHRMLLKPADLRKVFLSERIASVLHSRGRQVLYLKNAILIAEQKRYEWYTSVGLELTKAMSKDTEIKTAFEYIIEANNKLPRMLQKRTGEEDAEFLKRLKEARDIAKRLKEQEAETKFYENGVYKKMLGTPYSDLNALKYVIKANTKMYKISDVSVEDREIGLRDCDALYELSKLHVAKFGVASSCMIHAGKYYAAAMKQDKAFQAFESGFDHEGEGINKQLQSNTNIFTWAVYNMGRAIHVFGSKTPNRELQTEKFVKRYGLLKDQRVPVPGNLKIHLDNYINEL